MKCLKTTLLSRSICFFFFGCLVLFASASVGIDAKIVFCVDDDIFVMNDDGSRRHRITHTTLAAHRYPRWSPDMDKTQPQTTANSLSSTQTAAIRNV